VDAKEHVITLDTPGPVFGLSREARPGEVPWTAATALLALAVAVIGVLLLVLALGLIGTESAQGTRGATSAVALSALVSTIVIDAWFIGVAWWHSLRRFALSASSWGFVRLERRSLLLVPVGLALAYIALVVSMSVYGILFGPPPEQNIMKDFPHTGSGIVLFALTAIVVAPVFEETFFRGFLFQGFSRSWGPAVGAVASASLFALAHQQLSVFVPFFALGLVLAWVFYRSGSLWTNIAVHASFNCVSVLVWAAFGAVSPFRLPML
jgi:membrane protease YdiL (CAAX protease family)